MHAFIRRARVQVPCLCEVATAAWVTAALQSGAPSLCASLAATLAAAMAQCGDASGEHAAARLAALQVKQALADLVLGGSGGAPGGACIAA